MYKTALQLMSHRLKPTPSSSGVGKHVILDDIEQLGHTLLLNYKNTTRLHEAITSETPELVPGPLYGKALFIPIELLQLKDDSSQGSLGSVEALVLATIMFNFAIQRQSKLADHPHRSAKLIAKLLELYEQVHELAQRIVDHSGEASCPVSILSHFLKLASLNNQATLHSLLAPDTRCQVNDPIKLLLQHAVSNKCRSTDWKDFPDLQEDASDFILRAILRQRELGSQ